MDTKIIYAVLNIFTSYRCTNAWRIEDVGDNDRLMMILVGRYINMLLNIR